MCNPRYEIDKVLCLVCGDVDGKSPLLPINHGVGLDKPVKSEDDILLSTVHYMEKDLVENSSNANIEGVLCSLRNQISSSTHLSVVQ